MVITMDRGDDRSRGWNEGYGEHIVLNRRTPPTARAVEAWRSAHWSIRGFVGAAAVSVVALGASVLNRSDTAVEAQPDALSIDEPELPVQPPEPSQCHWDMPGRFVVRIQSGMTISSIVDERVAITLGSSIAGPSLAAMYDEIAHVNGLDNPDHVVVGDTLVFPPAC